MFLRSLPKCSRSMKYWFGVTSDEKGTSVAFRDEPQRLKVGWLILSERILAINQFIFSLLLHFKSIKEWSTTYNYLLRGCCGECLTSRWHGSLFIRKGFWRDVTKTRNGEWGMRFLTKINVEMPHLGCMWTGSAGLMFELTLNIRVSVSSNIKPA